MKSVIKVLYKFTISLHLKNYFNNQKGSMTIETEILYKRAKYFEKKKKNNQKKTKKPIKQIKINQQFL